MRDTKIEPGVITTDVRRVMLDMVQDLAGGIGRDDVEQQRRLDYLLLHAGGRRRSAAAIWDELEAAARAIVRARTMAR